MAKRLTVPTKVAALRIILAGVTVLALRLIRNGGRIRIFLCSRRDQAESVGPAKEIVGIQEADEIAPCQGDAFVHGVVQTTIRLADCL